MNYSFSIIDLLPYILLLGVFYIIGKEKINNQNKVKYAFIFLLIFDCIRFGVGYDYMSYVNMIYEQSQLYDYDKYTEPLSQILMHIAHRTHYQVFFLLSSFLTLFPIFLFCKRNSINPYLSLFTYVCFPFFFLSGMGVIRNAIAYSMVIMALYFLQNKKIYLAILFNIIAFGFHNSAIIGFLIYPLFYFKFGRKLSIIIYVLSLIFSSAVVAKFSFLFSGLSFFWKIEHYANDIEGGGNSINLLINIINIVLLIFWNRIIAVRKNDETYLRFTNFGACIWNVFFPLSNHMAERFSTFFFIYLIIVVPSLIYSFKKKITKELTMCVMVLIFASSFVLSIKAFVNGTSVNMSNLPYQVIFFHENYKNIYLDNPYE